MNSLAAPSALERFRLVDLARQHRLDGDDSMREMTGDITKNVRRAPARRAQFGSVCCVPKPGAGRKDHDDARERRPLIRMAGASDRIVRIGICSDVEVSFGVCVASSDIDSLGRACASAGAAARAQSPSASSAAARRASARFRRGAAPER
jgi:hypothetical protein